MCFNLHDSVMPKVVQHGSPRRKQDGERRSSLPDHGDEHIYMAHRDLCNLAHNAKADNRMQNYSAMENCIARIERHVRLSGHSHTLNLMHAVRHTWLPHTEGVLD